MSIKANKGEWGEPYVAIRVLGEGKLYIADADGNKNPHEWMDIVELSLDCYKNTMQNTEAIYLLHEALTSEFNSYEYAKQDTFNYGNVVLQLVTNTLANQGSVEKEASECLNGLFKLLSA